MSKPGDKSSQQSPGKESTPNPVDSEQRFGVPRDSHGRAPAVAQSSGRVAHDERGNSVWEWQLETGVYSRDISTQKLKKLDLNDLSIADTAAHRRPPIGVNPYDNSQTGGGKVGTNPYNSGGRGANKPGDKAAAPTRKPADMKKLQEWMELRKRVEQLKREEGED